jgi:[acyl-carrier-protein] S-malonyltransferase
MGLALLFPGQGSQFVGMGRDLADRFAEARTVFEEADDVLGFALSQVMFEGPDDELTATRNAQPALLTHSVAVLRVLGDRLGPVQCTAGHSLGEFSAHVAAGTLSFADALGAVRRRGELMFEAGQVRPGTMAAILGLDDDVIEEVCGRVGAGVCVPANFNSQGQVVISGDLEGVREGMELATEAGARRVVELNVSGAFHSPLMEVAEAGLAEHLAGLTFSDPSAPVYANVHAGPVSSGDEARSKLVEQLTAPVRWAASIGAMVEAGVDRFAEIGPGRVLAGLNRRNARGLPCLSIGTPEELDALET